MPSKPPRRENYSAGTKQLSSPGLSGRTKTPMNQPNQSRAETLRSLQPDAATQPHRTPEGAHSGARATDDLSCLCGHASWARARFRSMSRGIHLPSSRLLRAEVRCAARTPELCAGKVGDRCHQRRGKPANPENGNRHFAPGSDAAAAGVTRSAVTRRAACSVANMMTRALALASLPALVFSHGAMVTPRSRNSVVRPRRPSFSTQHRPALCRRHSLRMCHTGLARGSAEERWPRRDNLGLVPERHG